MKIYYRDMSCASCALDMEWELEQMDQVHYVKIDTLNNLIDIEFDGDTESMLEVIKATGKRYESGFALVEEQSSEEEMPPIAVWHRLNYLLPRVISSVLLLIMGSFLLDGSLALAAFLVSYILAGGDIIWRALGRIRQRDFFHEYFLMSLATLGAFAIHEYQEAVAVMVFYQIGEYLQDKALERSKDSIKNLMNRQIPLAHVLRGSKIVEANPVEVSIGEEILVRPGEEVPLDGTLIQGLSSVNNAAISGESMPISLEEEDEITAGAINLDAVIKIRVSKRYHDSGMARVMRLMQEAKGKKPPTERFISRFSRVYTKVVVLLAVLTVTIPTLLGGEFSTYIYRALIFLVVSCPCALVVSVPLGFFAGMGGFSKNHLLVKDPDTIEQLSQVKRIAFDKTNTLTVGDFQLKAIENHIGSADDLLLLVRSLERYSNHPLALSIMREGQATETTQEFLEINDLREIPGKGLEASHGAEQILVGNLDWLVDNKIPVPLLDQNGTYVYAARDAKYVGRILMQDELKKGAAKSVAALRKAGVHSLVMLTGDNEVHAKTVADALGLDEYEANMKPEEKLAWLEKQAEGEGKLAFVGDGINDAPSLVAADVGIAMGIKGSDLAIEAAGLVVMRDRLDDVPKALQLAKRSMRVIRQNIVMAIGLKVLVMLLGLVGLADLWMAVFADVGVTLLAVINSMRLLK